MVDPAGVGQVWTPLIISHIAFLNNILTFLLFFGGGGELEGTKCLNSVAALGIFLRVFLKKPKLHNLIKREIHILTTMTIKK